MEGDGLDNLFGEDEPEVAFHVDKIPDNEECQQYDDQVAEFSKEDAIFDELEAPVDLDGQINPSVPGEERENASLPLTSNKRATLTPELLVSPAGFPRLYLQSKKLKLGKRAGANHNFDTILNMYQTWGHAMFPRLEFSSLVKRVEKLCHSKRMRMHLSALEQHAKEETEDQPSGAKVSHPSAEVTESTGVGLLAEP